MNTSNKRTKSTAKPHDYQIEAVQDLLKTKRGVINRPLRTRTSKSPRLPKIPDMDKHTTLMCYLGMPTIKVARALGFPSVVCNKIEVAYESLTEMYIPLVSGPYGTFWYGSTRGLFFELVHPNVSAAVASLEEPLQLLAQVNKRVDLHLHLNIGTKHLSKKDQTIKSMLELLEANPSWKILEMRYQVLDN